MKESEARESSTTTVASNEDSGSSKDVIVVKKEDKVDVKPIVSNKKKQKRQLEVMQDTMKGLIKEVVDAQKASDKMYVELEEKLCCAIHNSLILVALHFVPLSCCFKYCAHSCSAVDMSLSSWFSASNLVKALMQVFAK